MNYKEEYDNKLGMVNYMNIFEENNNIIAILGEGRELACQSIGISLANLIGIHGISVAYIEPKFTEFGVIEELIDGKKKEKLKSMNLVNYYYQWDIDKQIESCEIVILDFSNFNKEHISYLQKIKKVINVHNLKLKKDEVYENLLQTQEKKYSNYYVEERYPKISDGKNSIASVFFGCSKQDLNLVENIVNYFGLKKRIAYSESTYYELIDVLNDNINLEKVFRKKLERVHILNQYDTTSQGNTEHRINTEGRYNNERNLGKENPYTNENRINKENRYDNEIDRTSEKLTFTDYSIGQDNEVEYRNPIDYSQNMNISMENRDSRMGYDSSTKRNVQKKQNIVSKFMKKIMTGLSFEDEEDENHIEEWSYEENSYDDHGKKSLSGKVFGKETIFITGLKHGCGCSHNSISIATFISKGYKESVCICHRKGAYSLEETKISEYTNEFGYDSIFSNHRFIVFDCGNLGELNQEQLVEMNRSNIKIMICNSDEKYLGQLSSFIQKMGDGAREWIYAFNLVTSKEKEVMIKRIMEGYKLCFIPVHDKENPERKITKTWDSLIKRGL